MNNFKRSVSVILLILAYSVSQAQTVQLIYSTDSKLNQLAQSVLPKVFAVCPGLTKYAADLSAVAIEKAVMRNYEGGAELRFKVSDTPKTLPSPLNVYSKSHHCAIIINPQVDRIYIPKTACHSLCTGTLQDNQPNLMGREYALIQ